MKKVKIVLIPVVLGFLFLWTTLVAQAADLVHDDFNGSALAPIWRLHQGYASVQGGWVTLSGSTPGTRGGYIVTGEGSTWSDYRLSTHVITEGGGLPPPHDFNVAIVKVRVQTLRGDNRGTYYEVYLWSPLSKGADNCFDGAGVSIVKVVNDEVSVVRCDPAPAGVIINDYDNRLDIEVIGTRIRVYVNDQLITDYTDQTANPIMTGGVSLGALWESTSRYDYIYVQDAKINDLVTFEPIKSTYQTTSDTTGCLDHIDDFTEHTYVADAGPIGTFADFPVQRTFDKPITSIRVTIVSGNADDIGYVGDIQVTPQVSIGDCSVIGTVVAPIDVTTQVTVSGNTARLLLRAQENCCCVTGWGSATQSDRQDARLHWEVGLAASVGQFSFDARLTNTSNSPLNSLVAEVIELTNNNLLQNADGGAGGVGARLAVQKEGEYADGILGPGESVDVHFIICLTDNKPFRFVVDVLGFKEGQTDSSQVAAVQSTSMKPRHAKFRKGSGVTRKGFFGRFRPYPVRNRPGH